MFTPGRVEGKSFEEVLTYHGKRHGLLVIQNKLTAKYMGGGRIQVEKSNLDFMISDNLGNVGFVDAKSFKDDSFSYSEISPHQIERADLYNCYKIPAGFVVFFRSTKNVYFFSGMQIKLSGPKNSFRPGNGLLLGPWHDFDLKLVLEQFAD